MAAKVQLMRVLLEKARLRARTNFYTFVRLMAPYVLPEEFKDGTHIKLICDHLQQLEEGHILRLMLCMPPGSMKSVLTNKLFTSWCIGRNPQWQVLSCSHKSELAMGFGRDVRDLMATEEYQLIFPGVKIRDDVRAAGNWITTRKGRYVAAGAGSNIAGMRGNLGILDDVLSEQSAYSDTERQKILDWYGPGFRTRMLPRARIVVVNTRWHYEDLSGYLLDKMEKSPNAEKWVVLSIPAILDNESAKLVGHSAGNSYWPEMWPKDELLKIRDSGEMSPAKWSALYMQRPSPEEGALFKKEYFKVWPHAEPPECHHVILSLDTAFEKTKRADNSVLQAWAVFDTKRTDSTGREFIVKNMLLLGQKTGKFEYPELKMAAEEYYAKFKPDVVLIEKKASGQSLIQDLYRQGLPVMPFQPDKDKITRANACTPIMAAGRVWIPERAWAEELVSEALQFPLGAHDDRVDAMTQAILYMRQSFQVGTEVEDAPVFTGRKTKVKTYWTDRSAIRMGM